MDSHAFYELFDDYTVLGFLEKPTGGSVLIKRFREHTEFDEEYKEFWAAYAVRIYCGGEPIDEL